MSNTRFLIAKYIRDLHRLEPRNIGVIVWLDGNIAARFLGEKNGTIESIVAPRYLRVQNQAMYRQWIEYWRYQISQPSLSLNGNGNMVGKSSPHFLDALRKCSKQQFILLEGGFLMGKHQKGEIQDIVDDLFVNLVEDEFISEKKEEESESLAHLKKTINQAFDDSGIRRSRDFSHNMPWLCSIEGNKYPFVFDYGPCKQSCVS
jgi:hypothetical protein